MIHISSERQLRNNLMPYQFDATVGRIELNLIFLNPFYVSFGKIHSGSELFVTSTGSFKRFESIDRDLKGGDQAPPLQSSSWNITLPELPPQPLRPAPKSPTHRERKKSLDKSSPEKHFDVLRYTCFFFFLIALNFPSIIPSKMCM